jgi:F-type H+-transporting ATPase subunit alpha
MRKVAGRLLDLAAYRELEAFSQFASELDAATSASLARPAAGGDAQPAGVPAVAARGAVTAIWAATNGYLDDVPVAQVPRFHEELRQSLRAEGTILKTIDESGDLSDETLETLKKAVDGFKEGFYVEEERGLAAAAG